MTAVLVNLNLDSVMIRNRNLCLVVRRPVKLNQDFLDYSQAKSSTTAPYKGAA